MTTAMTFEVWNDENENEEIKTFKSVKDAILYVCERANDRTKTTEEWIDCFWDATFRNSALAIGDWCISEI